MRYYNPQSVHRAFRMFAHLGMRLATLNPNIAERVPPDMQEKRVKSSGASEHSDGPKKPKKRKKSRHNRLLFLAVTCTLSNLWSDCCVCV